MSHLTVCEYCNDLMGSGRSTTQAKGLQLIQLLVVKNIYLQGYPC